MFFKRIEMHGFKSFAEPVTIQFDRGITCIVGPNGSGKSNISDAIRWVLGEQSPKMLRGGKMEDVIFAGTSTRKSRGMAEVTLVIDNQDGRLPIEYSEVAITRRMYRSGESEYAINNNKCRMRDIKELLVDTGIGVDGYSLIGQGKISDIISNKTESIREIFEETAGVVSYRTKKAEADRKLATSNINMNRVNDVVEEIESRIDNLREDSEKASEYLELKEKHRELEINITIDSIENLRDKIKIYKDDIESLEQQTKSGQEKMSSIEESLKTLAQETLEINRVSGEKNNLYEEVNREMGKALGDGRVSRERLNSIERDRNRIQREIDDIKENLHKEIEKSKELEVEKIQLDEKVSNVQLKLKEELEKNGFAKEERESKANKISRKKDDLFSMSKSLSVMISEQNSYENLLRNLSKNQSEASVNLNIYNENIQEIEKSLELEKKNRMEYMKENTVIKLEITENEKKRAELEKSIACLENSIKEKEIRQREIISRRATIQEMEDNYEGYNGGVRFIMKKDLPGIHGTVGDLGAPMEGYEVALETALGGKIQNIVCDDDYSAKLAIEKLKAAKAGRGTFLPISEIEGKIRRDRGLEAEAGFMGYADECIEYMPEYKGIFQHLLGNIAVVKSMDEAIDIWKKYGRGFKYVTLDGEIFNSSGAVTGGKYKNNTANLFERKGEIARLQRELLEIEAEGSKMRQEALKLEEQFLESDKEYKLLQERERESDNQVTRSVSLISAGEDKKEENRRALKTWKESCNKAEEESLRIEEKIKALSDEIVSTKEKIQSLEDDILKESEQLDLMEGSIRKAGETASMLRQDVSKWEKSQTNVNNLLDFSKSRIEEFKDDVSRREKQLKNLSYDIEGINRGIEIHDNLAAEKKIQRDKLVLELKELNNKKYKNEKLTGQLNSEKETLYGTIDKIKGQEYEINLKLARNESQMDSCKAKLWEEFQVSYAQALTMKKENFAVSAGARENRNIKNRIRELGEVNVGAIKEYAQVNERYKFLTAQRADIVKSTEELRQVIDDLDKIIKVKFKAGFDSIAKYFEEIFQEFFRGGQAKIVLEDESDPLNSNIEIIAQPPGKQLKNINLMSGGEKTMTAIALMFAVVKTKPTPCCILDEVEAALDDHNIHVFANYLRNFEDIQFTLITHQKTTMEHADVMYGVTMPEKGVSKVFSLKMDDDSGKID